MKKLILFYINITFLVLVQGEDPVMARDAKFQLLSGDLMPLIGFGTAGIKGTELVKNVLDSALTVGFRLIDTAKLYNNEEDIGKALKELLPKHNLTRQDIWITTKLAPENHGAGAYEALKDSLRRLGTDYVDLYLIHTPYSGWSPGPNDSRLRGESWKRLVQAQKDGLARNIGVSNYEVSHLQELLENNNGVKPAVNQVKYHPRYHPQGLLSFLQKEGILLQAYSSLGGSRLSLRDDPEIIKIAKKLGKTSSQVLLKWALQQNIAVIPKSKSKTHMEENLELDFSIPNEDMETLSNLSEKKVAY